MGFLQTGTAKHAVEALLPLAERLVRQAQGSTVGELLPHAPTGTGITVMRDALALAVSRGLLERRRSPGADYHRRARWQYFTPGAGGVSDLESEVERRMQERAAPYRPLRLAALWRGGPGLRVLTGEVVHSFASTLRTAVRGDDADGDLAPAAA